MAPSNNVAAATLALVVLLAGCSAGIDGPTTAVGTDQPGTAESPAAETGTLSFYVSDRPNAIGDFENLTVTITEIGVHRAAASDEGDNGGGDDGGTGAAFPNGSVSVSGDLEYNNETFPPNGSVSLDGNLTADGDIDFNGTVPNGTMNVTGTVDDEGNASLTGDVTYNETQFPDYPNGTVELEGTISQEGAVELNGTVTLFGEDATSGNVTLSGTVSPEESGADGEDQGESADGADAGWVTHAVDDETVDLTELQGDNATRIADVSLPAAEYNGVYLAVSNVSGILTTGETVDVKLPSDRLRLHKGFALGANATTSFVFDIAVHETGNGRYILRPVVGQSGPDVPIQAVGSARDGVPPQDGIPPQQGAQAGDGPQQGNGNASGNSGLQAGAQGGGPPGRQGGNASAAGRQPGNGTAA